MALIFLNFFSSITTWPLEAKFHVEPPWDRGTKSCSNGRGHMTKIGRCSQLNEYLKLYEYQRSRSLIDLGPNLSDSIFLNFSSITTWPLEAKFHVEPPWDRGTKSCSNGRGHMTKMAIMPIYGKNH